jgi:predicted ribonuclease YlaK
MLFTELNPERRTNIAVNALCNSDVPLVSLTGKAGTGKTLLALACALHVRKITGRFTLHAQSFL